MAIFRPLARLEEGSSWLWLIHIFNFFTINVRSKVYLGYNGVSSFVHFSNSAFTLVKSLPTYYIIINKFIYFYVEKCMCNTFIQYSEKTLVLQKFKLHIIILTLFKLWFIVSCFLFTVLLVEILMGYLIWPTLPEEKKQGLFVLPSIPTYLRWQEAM